MRTQLRVALVSFSVLLSTASFFFLQTSLAAEKGTPEYYDEVYGITGDALVIEDDTVWHKDDDLSFEKPVFIVNGATLTIEAGAQVFLGSASGEDMGYLAVSDGALRALGTAVEPIVMTDLNESRFNIDLYNYSETGESQETVLEHVIIRRGGKLTDSDGESQAFWKQLLGKVAGAQALEGQAVIRYYSGKVAMRSVTFEENEFADIEIWNSFVDPELPDDYLHVTDSSFAHDPLRYAVYLADAWCDDPQGCESRIAFTNNWWGDASGPRHVANPTGTGAKIVEVAGQVPFTPWLTAAPTTACTEDCFSNVLFLPGIESSRLYRMEGGNENQLWEPNRDNDVEKIYLDGEGQSVEDDIYTRDVIDELNVIPALQKNIYKSFLSDLESWKSEEGLINDYAALPYDWRFTLEEILNSGERVEDKIFYGEPVADPYILSELRRLAQTSKSGKVTIVAHSNGGLVTKALVNKLGPEAATLVDKIVFVAVPQTGTPQAIGALLHGYDQGLPFDSVPVILTPRGARAFAKNFVGAYPLLPSKDYFETASATIDDPVISFESGELTDTFIEKYGETIGDFDELWAFLKDDDNKVAAEASDTETPGRLNESMLDYAEEVHETIGEDWNRQNIPIYQIAGIGEETLSGITYKTRLKCVDHGLLGQCLKHEPKIEYTPELVLDGDGTVITPSALSMSDSEESVKRYWVNVEDYNKAYRLNIDRKHADILEINEVRELIRDNFITDENSSIPKYVSDSNPLLESKMRLRYFLHSPLTLSVQDQSGNEVGAEKTTISGAEYRRFGEVQYISVPAESKPTVVLDGLEKGSFTLEIQETEGETVVAQSVFTGVPSAKHTRVTMDFGGGTLASAGKLEIDYNGDGITDQALAPILNGVVTPSLPSLVTEKDEDDDNDSSDDSSEDEIEGEVVLNNQNPGSGIPAPFVQASLGTTEQNPLILANQRASEKEEGQNSQKNKFPFAKSLSGALIPTLRGRELISVVFGIAKKLTVRR